MKAQIAQTAAGLLAALLLVALPTAAAAEDAAVPQLLDVQGYLHGTGGAPVHATVKMKITLYDAADGGNELYSEELPAVPVTGSRFSVLAGTINPLDGTIFSDNGSVFVGVSVDDTEELPRVQLVSVPYAFHAQRAARAGSADTADLALALDCAGCVSDAALAEGTVGAPHLAPGAVTSQAVSNGAIGASALSEGAVSSAALADEAVTGAKLLPGAVGPAHLAGCGNREIYKMQLGKWTCAQDEGTSYTGDAWITVFSSSISLNKSALDVVYVGKQEVGAITTAMIAPAAVDAATLGVGAVTAEAIAEDAVQPRHLGACAAGEILKREESGWTCAPAADAALVAGPGITVTGTNISLDEQHVAKSFVAKGEAEAVSAGMLAPGAVQGNSLGDGAVTQAKLSGSAVTEAKLGDGAVATAKLKDGAVNGPKLAPGAVGGDQLAAGGVLAKHVGGCAQGEVLKNKDGDVWDCAPDDNNTYEAGAGLELDGAVLSLDTEAADAAYVNEAQTGAVTRDMLAAGAVTTDAVKDESLVDADIAPSAALDPTKVDGVAATLTGDQSFEEGTLFVDADDDRVGVGTTDPQAKLHVAGTLRADGRILGDLSPQLGDGISGGTSLEVEVAAEEPSFFFGWGRAWPAQGTRITIPIMDAVIASHLVAYSGVDGGAAQVRGLSNFASLKDLGDRQSIDVRSGVMRLFAISRQPDFSSGWQSCGNASSSKIVHDLGTVPEVAVLEVAENDDGSGWRAPAMGSSKFHNSAWRQASIVELSDTEVTVKTYGEVVNLHAFDGSEVAVISAYCRVQLFDWTPDYDSGWTSISTAAGDRDKWFRHDLHRFPSLVMAYVAQNNDGSGWFVPILSAAHANGTHGAGLYDVNERWIVVKGGQSTLAYFMDAAGTPKSPQAGYVRVMAWR